MTKQVDFHCVITVDGKQWPITLHGQVDTEDIGRHLTEACRWLLKNGIRPAGTQLDAPQGPTQTTGTEARCPDHGAVMRVSKFTKNGASITYYCPVKSDDEFCDQTASIVRGSLVYNYQG